MESVLRSRILSWNANVGIVRLKWRVMWGAIGPTIVLYVVALSCRIFPDVQYNDQRDKWKPYYIDSPKTEANAPFLFLAHFLPALQVSECSPRFCFLDCRASISYCKIQANTVSTAVQNNQTDSSLHPVGNQLTETKPSFVHIGVQHGEQLIKAEYPIVLSTCFCIFQHLCGYEEPAKYSILAGIAQQCW